MTADNNRLDKPFNRYKTIRAVIALPGLVIFSQIYFFQPLLPTLVESFSVTPAMSSLTISAGMFGIAFGLFLLAIWADRWERKKLIITSLLWVSVTTVLSAVSWIFPVLIFFSFVKGILVAGFLSVMLAYIAEEVPVQKLGIVIGIYLAGNVLGGMWGRVAAGVIASWYDWRVTTIVIGAIGLLITIILARTLPVSTHHRPQKIQGVQKLLSMKGFLKDPLLLRIFLIMIILMGVFVSVYNYLSFRLESPPFSLSRSLISFVFLFYTMGMAGSLVTGAMTRRYSPFTLLKILFLLFGVSLLGLAFNALFLLVLGLAVFTYSLFGIHTLMNKIISQHVIREKSTANSLYLISYYVGSGVIGSLTGVLIQKWGWFYFILILMGLVFVSALMVRRVVE
jgi:YNFM family putative membrane transporter